MTLLLVYVALALGVSFLCSVLEAVLLSLTPSYVSLMRDKHPRAGALLHGYKTDVDRPLAAILSLNTIAHTVGATGAGAQAVRVFGEAWIGVISAVLTLLILVLSEIVPKTLGATYWRSLAIPVAHTLRALMIGMGPLVWMSQGITRLIARGDNPPAVSHAELAALAESGQEEGIFAPRESHIVQSLMKAAPLRARDVMTPRVVMAVLDENLTVGDVDWNAPELRFTRIPVFAKTRDHLTGYVRKDELLLARVQGETDRTLASLRRPLLVAPESLPLGSVLEEFLGGGDVIAQVIDEHGGVDGLITMEDVVESLTGLEIVDEYDSVEDMRALAKTRWRDRAQRLGLLEDDDR